MRGANYFVSSNEVELETLSNWGGRGGGSMGFVAGWGVM